MEETNQQPLALRVCAELAGSFLLCFAIYAFSTWGSAVYGINIVFFALATGLAYAAVTAIFSRVSGGQLNPAITVASVLVSKTKILDGILYVIAQVIGAIAAGFAVVKLLPTSEQVAAKVWLTPAVNGFENGSVSYSLLTQYGITFSITLAIVVEVVASLIVVATAMSSLGDHGESSDRHVIAMGLAYGLATAISYPVTGAGLNPARSTGIALAAMNEGLTQNPLQQLWVFWISPVLAAAVVALVMIIAQMMTTPKVPAAADLPQTDADANADTLDDGEFFDQAASSDGDSAEKDVAEESKEAEVGLNNTVTLYMEDDDEEETYRLVTSIRGNSLSGLISTESPIGKAILGHKVGDRVEIKVSDDFSYYVVIRKIDKTESEADDKIRSF